MSDTLFVKNSTKILATWLNDANTNTYSAANKAALVLLTPALGLKVFVSSSDGGLFKAVVGAAATTYSDNGGAYCGTVTIPTGGDGSIAWVRVDGGYNAGLPMQTVWFGEEIQNTIDNAPSKKVILSDTIHVLAAGLDIPDGLDLGGAHPFTTIIDASGVTGGAIKINGTTSPDDSFENIHLHGFTLDGGASVANVGDHGIDIYKTTRIKLSWLIVKRFADNGLNFRGRNFHVEVDTVDCAGNLGWNASVEQGGTRNNAFLWKNFRTYRTGGQSAGSGQLYLNQCNTHKFINCNLEDVNCTAPQIYMGDNVNNIDFDTLYSENNARVGSHIIIDGSGAICKGIKFSNSNIASSADTAKITLLDIDNGSDIEIDGGRLELYQTSNTYAHECIATSANTGMVRESTSFTLTQAASVERNITTDPSTISNYRIFDRSFNDRLDVITKTASDALTVSGFATAYTNSGAGAIIETELPPADSDSSGGILIFVRRNATHAYQIQPSSGHSISGGGTDKYLSLDTNGATVTLIRVAGTTWDVLSSSGTISYEP